MAFFHLLFYQKGVNSDAWQGSKLSSALTVDDSENSVTEKYLKLDHHNGTYFEHRIKS